jgi:hypothetical protein
MARPRAADDSWSFARDWWSYSVSAIKRSVVPTTRRSPSVTTDRSTGARSARTRKSSGHSATASGDDACAAYSPAVDGPSYGS